MQSSVDLVPRPTPWYTHRWPWLLMLGPFLVVVAALITAWIAFSQQDALVVDDYYKQGKAINQDLRRDRAAANMKLSVNARYDAAAGRLFGTVLIDGKPLAALLKLKLIHSTLPEKDIGFDVESDSRGTFSAALPMLEKARWQVLVQDNGGVWRLSGNWIWPQQKSVDLRAAAPAPLD